MSYSLRTFVNESVYFAGSFILAFGVIGQAAGATAGLAALALLAIIGFHLKLNGGVDD